MFIQKELRLGNNQPTLALFDDYNIYKETRLEGLRFNHAKILPLIKELEKYKLFNVSKAGESLEGRDIFLITVGTGNKKILSWSQMHGDEPTATMALFDVFRFLSSDDKYNEFREKLLSEVTLYFIPMLNPDGAEKFRRQNALGIDLNRDAQKLFFPESKILMSLRNKIKPDFGFNLHDQTTGYAVGYTGKPASISFVAPPFNNAKSLNETRKNSMKVIVGMFEELNKIIPGQIARYSDDFEPRAFGDNFIMRGTSSILIESGGCKDDPEKQFLRKINFVALLSGFNSIANKNYTSHNVDKYFSIPENRELLFDLLLKNITMEYNGSDYLVDIGINREKRVTNNGSDFYFKGIIEEIGDLSVYSAYDIVDCKEMTIDKGKTYPTPFFSSAEIEKLDFPQLHREGYLAVQLEDKNYLESWTKLPINILLNKNFDIFETANQQPANFILKSNDVIKLIVINGFAHDITKNKISIQNGLIIN